MNGPPSKLNETIHCQPAVVVSSLAALEKLKAENPDVENQITDVAGFSVGEFSALTVAGVFSFEQSVFIRKFCKTSLVVKLVKIRAEAMHACNKKVPSGMVTIRTLRDSQLSDALTNARRFAE